MGTSNGFLERDTIGIAAGRWAFIEKRAYRPTNIEHAVYVPLMQAGALGVACGATAATALAVTRAGGSLVAAGGGLVTLAVFTVALFDGVNYARNAVEAIELWESEASQSGGAERSTVRVEIVERRNVGGRVVYDELDIDAETLTHIMSSGAALSKRGLMDAGVSDTEAMRIVAQLLAFGYAARERSNEPAVWTAKGRALARAFTGGAGGGGGGGLVETSETSAFNGVGGGEL